MPTIDLPQGTVHFRIAGPDDAARPPVVFVHGFLVDSRLWDGVAAPLAERGVRSYAPDWPLGSHTIPMAKDAECSPRGVARMVAAFLEALDLEDVTLVGNDTGGAICQFVLDTDASRVGRVALTNCDAFDTFPPAPFDTMFKTFRSARAIPALLAPMRSTAVRHSPAGYGLLADRLDAAVTRAWVDPGLSDAAIRRDMAAFVRAVDPAELLDVASRVGRFEGSVLLVWGTGDRFFKPELGRRLEKVFADARMVEIEGARTFVSLDHPERVAEEIDGFLAARELSPRTA